MAEVLFYHLEQASLEAVLPDLLNKTLSRGWKAVVRVGSDEWMQHLDTHLWTYDEESFLPHAAEGDGAAQPVWLTTQTEMPNSPDLLFLVDRATAEPEELEALTRCVLIFDGADEEALATSRSFWKVLKGSEHAATYWRQSVDGRWEKQA